MFKKIIIMLLFNMLSLNLCFAWNENMPDKSILIFVSFSMPKASLQAWTKQAVKADAALLMRGLVQHSFPATAKAVQELVVDGKGGVAIDPTLFKRFNIQQVPAVVLIAPTCLRDTRCQHYHLMYGNTNLDYVLKAMANEHDDLTRFAQSGIDKLKRGD